MVLRGGCSGISAARAAVVVLVLVWGVSAKASFDVASAVWLPTFEGPVEFVALSEDGLAVLAGSGKEGVRIFGVEEGRWGIVASIPVEGCEPEGAAWAGAGGLIVVSCGGRGLVGWDVAGGQARYSVPPADGTWTPDQLRDWSVSGDGKLLGTIFESGTFALWDAATGRPAAEPHANSHRGSSIHFSPDGERVAILHGYTPTSHGASLTVYDTRTMDPFGWMPGLSSPAQFDPSGRILVAEMEAGGCSTAASIWHVDTATLLYYGYEDLTALSARVMGQPFEPDDRAAASRIAWSLGEASAESALPDRCSHGWTRAVGGYPVAAVAEGDVLHLCDVQDAWFTEVRVNAEILSLDIARTDGLAVLGLADGRIAVVRFVRRSS